MGTADPLVAVAEAAGRRFTALLRAVPDPSATAVGEWSVRDVAAHVAAALPTFLSVVQGRGSPLSDLADLAKWNAEGVAAAGGDDLAALAARIDGLRDQALALAAAGAGPSATVVPYHGGIPLPLSAAWALLGAEWLVHGHDVARGAGRPWPVPAHEARAVLMGSLPVLPHFVATEEAAGLRARFELRLRGGGDGRVVLAFADGNLAVDPPEPGRVDCHISADPSAWLLVAYGRLSPLRPALTGRIVVWGGRPHLAFRLTRLFRNP